MENVVVVVVGGKNGSNVVDKKSFAIYILFIFKVTTKKLYFT
jgi:hypothetical protein